jgi:hypothetical protein
MMVELEPVTPKIGHARGGATRSAPAAKLSRKSPAARSLRKSPAAALLRREELQVFSETERSPDAPRRLELRCASRGLELQRVSRGVELQSASRRLVGRLRFAAPVSTARELAWCQACRVPFTQGTLHNSDCNSERSLRSEESRDSSLRSERQMGLVRNFFSGAEGALVERSATS